MERTILARIAAQTASMFDRFLRLGEGDQTAEEADRIRAVRLSVVGTSTPWMMAANLCNAILTLFAFSSENWRRPEEEVSDLMGLLRHFIRAALDLEPIVPGAGALLSGAY